MLSGTEWWFWLVGGAGAVTLLLGAYVAMFQSDLKRLLAYSTISHLGLITLLFGSTARWPRSGCLPHHEPRDIQGLIFMAAGIIDHETGTRDIGRLNGLIRAMPRTGALALVATGAMAGVPLLNGFLSKEMFFTETVFLSAHPAVEWGLPLLATVAAVFAVVYSLRFGYDIFFGEPSTDLPRTPEEPPPWMRVPIQFLVLTCLVVGIVPTLAIGPVLAAAARPVVGGSLPPYSLAVWHGFALALLMSGIAIGCGIAGYLWLRKRQARGRFMAHHVEPLERSPSLRVATLHCHPWSRNCSVGDTRRLQPHVRHCCGHLVAGVVCGRGVPLAWGDRPRVPLSHTFVLLWVICRSARSVPLPPRNTIEWCDHPDGRAAGHLPDIRVFSAPDLALTQIVGR